MNDKTDGKSVFIKDGYQPAASIEKGYQPSNSGSVQNGYKPTTAEGGASGPSNPPAGGSGESKGEK